MSLQHNYGNIYYYGSHRHSVSDGHYRSSSSSPSSSSCSGSSSDSSSSRELRELPIPPCNNAMFHPRRYKTEKCFNFEEKGFCCYGNRCLYAHGEFELQPATYRHPKFKTSPCRAFHEDGYCSFGPRCSFIHTKPDVDRLLKVMDNLPRLPMPENPSESAQGKPFYVDLSYLTEKRRPHDVEQEMALLPNRFAPDYRHRLPVFVAICSNDEN